MINFETALKESAANHGVEVAATETKPIEDYLDSGYFEAIAKKMQAEAKTGGFTGKVTLSKKSKTGVVYSFTSKYGNVTYSVSFNRYYETLKKILVKMNIVAGVKGEGAGAKRETAKGLLGKGYLQLRETPKETGYVLFWTLKMGLLKKSYPKDVGTYLIR